MRSYPSSLSDLILLPHRGLNAGKPGWWVTTRPGDPLADVGYVMQEAPGEPWRAACLLFGLEQPTTFHETQIGALIALFDKIQRVMGIDFYRGRRTL